MTQRERAMQQLSKMRIVATLSISFNLIILTAVIALQY